MSAPTPLGRLIDALQTALLSAQVVERNAHSLSDESHQLLTAVQLAARSVHAAAHHGWAERRGVIAELPSTLQPGSGLIPQSESEGRRLEELPEPAFVGLLGAPGHPVVRDLLITIRDFNAASGKQAQTMIRLTWAIVYLTIVIGLLAAVQIALMVKGGV